MPTKFGERLQGAIGGRMTLPDVASAVGVKYSTFYKWVEGRNEPRIPVPVIVKIAKVVDQPVKYFYPEIGDELDSEVAPLGGEISQAQVIRGLDRAEHGLAIIQREIDALRELFVKVCLLVSVGVAAVGAVSPARAGEIGPVQMFETWGVSTVTDEITDATWATICSDNPVPGNPFICLQLTPTVAGIVFQIDELIDTPNAIKSLIIRVDSNDPHTFDGVVIGSGHMIGFNDSTYAIVDEIAKGLTRVVFRVQHLTGVATEVFALDGFADAYAAAGGRP